MLKISAQILEHECRCALGKPEGEHPFGCCWVRTLRAGIWSRFMWQRARRSLRQSGEAGSRREMNRGQYFESCTEDRTSWHASVIEQGERQPDGASNTRQNKTENPKPNQIQKKKTGSNLPLGSINKGVNYGSVTQEQSGTRRAQHPRAWGWVEIPAPWREAPWTVEHKLVQSPRKTGWRLLTKLRTELPCEPAVSLFWLVIPQMQKH